MKRVLKRLSETRIGASPIPTGSIVIFTKNEEAWTGRVSETGTCVMESPFITSKTPFPIAGKYSLLT
jgi:hypothetical protein